MRKNVALIIIVITALLVGVTGCGNDKMTAQNDENKVLTILQGVDATTLDPAMHSDSPTGNIEYQIFDTLLKRNSEMKIQKSVAESWVMINDTTWEFTLRDDVYFHNNTKLTAEDVKFSIERILDPSNGSARISNYKSIEKVEAVNDILLRITTKKPNPVLLTRLADLRIVPKNYVIEVGNSDFSLNPIGSGPYKLSKWVKDEYISLEANENYWNGSPQIKQVTFKPVPEASARVMSLQSGEADIITNLPPHLISEIENDENLKAQKVDSTRFIMLSITTSRESVENVKVRQAINYAIDRDSLINNLLNGNGTISNQPVCNFDLGYNKELAGYQYNPELAKQLLAEAGYEKGIKLVMKSPAGRYLMDKEVAEAIKGQLQEVGIEVDLTYEEWGSYVTSIIKGTIDADIWLIGWGSSTFDAGTTLYQFLHTEQPVAQYDVNEDKNKWVNESIEKALATMNDLDRESIYHEVIEKIVEDAPFVNLYQQRDLYGVSTRINWAPRSDELIELSKATWN